ncbi:hypothetical protein T492DRAFT_909996 [Pavlovales sp. CCMP2436]|nr:hypothetical protein T492DRAFT_909996 [Pavlovales sp. CCMP2436]
MVTGGLACLLVLLGTLPTLGHGYVRVPGSRLAALRVPRAATRLTLPPADEARRRGPLAGPELTVAELTAGAQPSRGIRGPNGGRVLQGGARAHPQGAQAERPASARAGDAAAAAAAAAVSKPRAASGAGPPLSTPRPASARRADVRVHVRKIYDRAQQLLKRNNLHDSRELLQTCLQLDDSDAHSWLALARVEALTGSLRGARALIAEALIKCPGNVHLMHAGALFDGRMGRLEDARALFKDALAASPGNTYVVHAWGLLEQQAGQVELARELYSRSVVKRPHAPICQAWAALEAMQGNPDLARTLHRQAVELVALDGGGLARGVPAPAERVKLVDGLLTWAEFEHTQGNDETVSELVERALATGAAAAKCHAKLAQLEERSSRVTSARGRFKAAAACDDADASIFNLWASFERRQGKLDEALRILREGSIRFPRDAVLLQSAGTLQERNNNVEAARDLLARSIRCKPRAPAYVAWALLESRAGEYARARQLFDAGFQLEPSHGPLHNAYAAMESRLGNHDAARLIFANASKAHPTPDLWHGWGSLELRLGKTERARWLWARGASAAAHDTSFLWHSLGCLELGGGNMEAADAAFTAGLRRMPRSSPLLLGRARVRIARGDVDGARKVLRQAVNADAAHAHAWQAWGLMEKAQGNTQVAIDLFKRGLAHSPEHGALWQAYGKLEAERRNASGARSLFKQGLQQAPDHAPLVAAWARLELHEGQDEVASVLVRNALAKCGPHPNPRPPELLTLQLQIALRQGDRALARFYFEDGIRSAPKHAPLFRIWALSEEQKGDYAKARVTFEDGLRADPHHAQLYHAWARMEGKLANLDGLAKLAEHARRHFSSQVPARSSASVSGELIINQSLPPQFQLDFPHDADDPLEDDDS